MPVLKNKQQEDNEVANTTLFLQSDYVLTLEQQERIARLLTEAREDLEELLQQQEEAPNQELEYSIETMRGRINTLEKWSALIPETIVTATAIKASTGTTANANDSALKNLDLESLIKKYTPFLAKAHSSSANYTSGSYLKIGSIILGGEVQSIRIIEDKALQVSKGMRTNADFIVSNGLGHADIEITTIFNNKDSIINLLRPLIALFRISPITSVKNRVIEDALYDKFTENNLPQPKIEVINDIASAINASMIKERRARLENAWNSFSPEDTKTFNEIQQLFVTEDNKPTTNQVIWNQMISAGLIDPEYKTMVEWLADEEDDSIRYTQDRSDLMDKSDPEEAIDSSSDPYNDPLRQLDKTGHVPVAFIGFQLMTHPEFPEAIIAILHLKRIHVGNFAKDYLQYKSFNGTSTPDAVQAFWLNRAIQTYLDRYLTEDFLSESLTGEIALEYAGQNIELDRFKSRQKLEKIVLNMANNHNQTPIAVTQLSYSIQHKFAFHRLIGESYPTCQHLGTSTGTLSLSVKTSVPSSVDTEAINHFEKLHEFKNAADFFARHTDRATRYNGWKADCMLTRLVNFKANPLSKDIDTLVIRNAFYPKNVVSETDPESPYTRDVNITFIETLPDFFSNYGFSIKKSGFNIDILYEMYITIVDRANVFRNKIVNPFLSEEGANLYSFQTVYGSGNIRSNFHLVNPDTLMATFLQTAEYDDDTNLIQTIDIEPYAIPRQILDYLLHNEKFSGTLAPGKEGLEVLLAQAAGAVFSLTDVKLPRSIATSIAEKYFFITGDTDTNPFSVDANVARMQKTLIDHIVDLPEKEGRENLYQLVFNNPNITFTPVFFERLFVTLIKREKLAHDRLYNKVNVVKAFDVLTIAIDSVGEELQQDMSEKLSKRPSDDTKIIIDHEGRLITSTTYNTCYNDYMFMTYKQLFDLPDEGLIDNWVNYSYTFQDLGMINTNLDAYDDSFSAGSVTKAMVEAVNTGDSPIPPSIYFYREKELDELRTGLDKTSQDYFDKLATLKLELPFDIRVDVVDDSNRITGDQGVPDEVTAAYPNQTIGKETSQIIEDGIKKLASTRNDIAQEMAADIVLYEFKELARRKGVSPADLARDAKNGGLPQEYYNELLRFYRIRRDGVSVPILLGTHINSPVTQYRVLSGIKGEGIARILVENAVTLKPGESTSNAMSRFIDATIMRAASGNDDEAIISSANKDEVRQAMLKITQAVADNKNDLIKAFPTFRLYFLDFRGPRILVRDNFYGYNAIESIDITIDKNDPALAVIRIADPMYILQGDLNDIEIKNSSVINQSVFSSSSADLETDNILERFTLKQGRAIQIRGGYAAEPEHLDILFTGRISEISYGDVITVIAQGWKAELINKQVEFELHSMYNRSVKDLVVTTIRHSAPAGMGDVFSYEDLQSIKAIKNKLSVEEQINQSYIQGHGTAPVIFSGSAAGTTGITIWGLNFFGGYYAGLDLRLKNVWVPDVESTFFKGFASVITVGWNGNGWVVPLQPAWQVLQNATNYVWGYICQVVPYDGEATLFFGRPDQMYHFTNGSSSIAKKYREAKARPLDELNNAFQNIFNAFLLSYDYNNQFSDITLSDSIDITNINGEQLVDIESSLLVSISNLTLSSREGYPIQAQDTSYTLYKKIINKTNVSDMARDFRPYLNNIADIAFAQDRSEAAILLICSFYGLSPEFIKNYFPQEVRFIAEEIFLGPRPDKAKLTSFFLDILPTRDKSNLLGAINENDVMDPNLANNAKREINSDDKPRYYVLSDHYNFSKRLRSGLSNINDTTSEEITISRKPDKFLGVKSDREDVKNYFKALASVYEFIFRNDAQSYTSVSNDEYPVFKISIKQEFAREHKLNLNSIEDVKNIALKTIDDALYNSKFNGDLIDGNSLISNFYKDLAIDLGNQGIVDRLQNLSQKNLVDIIYSNLKLFRAYVYYMSRFLSNPDNIKEPFIQESIDTLKEANIFDWRKSLNMKVFRDYHYIRDSHDILENNIAASTREMYNTIVIRHPQELPATHEWIGTSDFDTVKTTNETEWVTWPASDRGIIGLQFNDSITYEDKKVAVHTDLNAERKEQAAKVATSVLTKLMRPMYRNTLTILGRPIKPWDHILLNDKYTDMYGPIDVERVVHHYDISRGWVTNVIPHLVAEANPGARAIQDAIFSQKMDQIYDWIDYAFFVFTAATAFSTAGASLGVRQATRGILTKAWTSHWKGRSIKELAQTAYTGTIKDEALRKSLRDFSKVLGSNSLGILKTFLVAETSKYGIGEVNRLIMTNMGVGQEKLPVIIMPLIFKGVQLTAGLKGEETDYFSVGSQLHWSFKDTLDGINEAFSIFSGPVPTANSETLGRTMSLLSQEE